MANDNGNLVGEFNVSPEALTEKATNIKSSLDTLANSARLIENYFSSIKLNELWIGPLADNFFTNYEQFYKRGEGNTAEDYVMYSGIISQRALDIYNFLNEASGGYLNTDKTIEKGVSADAPAPETTTDAPSV